MPGDETGVAAGEITDDSRVGMGEGRRLGSLVSTVAVGTVVWLRNCSGVGGLVRVIEIGAVVNGTIPGEVTGVAAGEMAEFSRVGMGEGRRVGLVVSTTIGAVVWLVDVPGVG